MHKNAFSKIQQKLSFIADEYNQICSTLNLRNNEVINLLEEYSNIKSLFDTSVMIYKQENTEKLTILNQFDKLKSQVSIFLPHFENYIQDEEITL